MTALAWLAIALMLWAATRVFSRLSGLYQPGEEIRLTASDRALFLLQGGFYQALSPQGKARFEHRVVELVYEKDWEGHGLEVTREMKVRIAAALAQLTFGFNDLLLLHFRRITIHPDAYGTSRTGRRHIGEAVPGLRGLAFSWKHFVEGFSNPGDALNVGLHEAAHALWFENMIPNGEYDFLPSGPLALWKRSASEEMERIRSGRSRLFRAYAATNEAEFFAVAVEYFFEQPVQYRERLPELYACMCKLLRQDPASGAAGPVAGAG
ncbi:MAG: zinc-dependent peptidase [Flavobacteriales bacterium]|nr:zinc-dependent peptidase [Flavobacteriales bacterium]